MGVPAAKNRAQRNPQEKSITGAGRCVRDGLLGLQNIAAKEPDKFAKKGLELLVDGNEPEVICKILRLKSTAVLAVR